MPQVIYRKQIALCLLNMFFSECFYTDLRVVKLWFGNTHSEYTSFMGPIVPPSLLTAVFSKSFLWTQCSYWHNHKELNSHLPKHLHFYFVRVAVVCLIITFRPCIWMGKWLEIPYNKKSFSKMFSEAKHFQDVIGTCMSKFIHFMGLFWGLDMLLMQSPRNLGKALFKSWKSLHKFMHTKNSKSLI